MMRTLFVALTCAGLIGTGAALAQSAPPAAPEAGPSATPSPTSTAWATPPQPSPTPAYHFIWRPTPSPDSTPASAGQHGPEIREIDLGDQTLVTPGELRVRVRTNPEVVSVTARTLGREIAIPRRDAGLFVLSGMVPQVPGFLSGRVFDVDFVAATDDGRTATVTLQLGLE